jgi:hypothetical protein
MVDGLNGGTMMFSGSRSIPAVLAATVLAMAGGVAAPPAVWAQPPATPAAKPPVPPELRATFRKSMIDGGGEFMKQLIELFPVEYEAFETGMLQDFLAGTLTNDEARRRGFEFSKGLVPRMYEGWQMAPDDDVLAASRVQLKTGRELAKSDARLCSEFLEGSTSPATSARMKPGNLGQINEANLAMIRLGKAGRAARVKRTPPDATVLIKVVDAYTAQGGDERWLEGLSSGDFAGLDYAARCDSAIKWLEVVHQQEKSLAARILSMD